MFNRPLKLHHTFSALDVTFAVSPHSLVLILTASNRMFHLPKLRLVCYVPVSKRHILIHLFDKRFYGDEGRWSIRINLILDSKKQYNRHQPWLILIIRFNVLSSLFPSIPSPRTRDHQFTHFSSYLLKKLTRKITKEQKNHVQQQARYGGEEKKNEDFVSCVLKRKTLQNWKQKEITKNQRENKPLRVSDDEAQSFASWNN